MGGFDFSDFVRERDAALTTAVMEDDFEPIRAFLERYNTSAPSKENVFKAGIYKAVQECTGIPDEVKAVAAKKCVAMGFSPRMVESDGRS